MKEQSYEIFDSVEGTLYPLLHRLEKQNFLQSYWQEVGGRRRKYYAITRQGKKVMQEKKAEWQTYSKAVSAIIA